MEHFFIVTLIVGVFIVLLGKLDEIIRILNKKEEKKY